MTANIPDWSSRSSINPNFAVCDIPKYALVTIGPDGGVEPVEAVRATLTPDVEKMIARALDRPS